MSIDDITVGLTGGDIHRSFRFEEAHFKRWRKKMLFFLTMKKVVDVLNTPKPFIDGNADATKKETQSKVLASWTENDFLCKNFILNDLSDDLYDYYYNTDDSPTSKIWEALQKKYDTEDVGTKKYVVPKRS